jgi:hypothetical protein
MKRILEKIEKCDLVCTCCHRLRTQTRMDELGTSKLSLKG